MLECLAAGRATEGLQVLRNTPLVLQGLLSNENICSPAPGPPTEFQSPPGHPPSIPVASLTGMLFVEGELEFHTKAFFP